MHHNPECIEKNINPIDHGSAVHTDMWKTEGLKQIVDERKFDVMFGGARRDEEKSRAKERVFSIRSPQHQWDPKRQRPELWQLYNGRRNKGETVRVFPISNWTELDVWQYIHLEQIPLVDLQGGDLDFALLLDGLSAEREQGITIDVAYRFFTTEHPIPAFTMRRSGRSRWSDFRILLSARHDRSAARASKSSAC